VSVDKDFNKSALDCRPSIALTFLTTTNYIRWTMNF